MQQRVRRRAVEAGNDARRSAMSVTEARWRLALGIAQMIAAASVPIAWLEGAPMPVVITAVVLTFALTVVSIARWGGFWRQQ
ncbi:MAG TPA: hypothetical protein VGE94_05720 [Chloroflexota bacterium]